MRILRNVLGVLLSIAVLALGMVFFEYYKMNSRNEKIEKMVVYNEEQNGEPSAMKDDFGERGFGEVSNDFLPQIDFEALRDINENCVGWLYACGGEISYPVVASQDEFYLKHAIDGSASKSGAIFVNSDPGDAFPSNRTVIYGHNMRDGSMFHSLLQYWRDDSYREKNPYIYIITESETYIYVVTSVYVAEYKDIVFTISTNPDTAKIIDLITCEYSGEDTRLVVEAMECLD